jgi:hypothetical protein
MIEKLPAASFARLEHATPFEVLEAEPLEIGRLARPEPRAVDANPGILGPIPQAGRVTTPRSETPLELHRREFTACRARIRLRSVGGPARDESRNLRPGALRRSARARQSPPRGRPRDIPLCS